MLTFTQFLSEGSRGLRRSLRKLDVLTRNAKRASLYGLHQAALSTEPVNMDKLGPGDYDAEMNRRYRNHMASELLSGSSVGYMRQAEEPAEIIAEKNPTKHRASPEQEELVDLTIRSRKKMGDNKPKLTKDEGLIVNAAKTARAVQSAVQNTTAAMAANTAAENIRKKSRRNIFGGPIPRDEP